MARNIGKAVSRIATVISPIIRVTVPELTNVGTIRFSPTSDAKAEDPIVATTAPPTPLRFPKNATTNAEQASNTYMTALNANN